MLKNLIKPVFFLPYLTICGTGYHMSFWNEFGLNGLNFISLADIIKSAAQPISYPILFIVLSCCFYYVLFHILIKIMKVPKEAFLRKHSLQFRPWYWVFTIISIISGFLMLNLMDTPFRWAQFSLIVSPPLISIFFVNGFLLEDIPDPSLRFSLIILIVLLPFLSFSSGKMDAENIIKNISYKYVVNSSDNPCGQLKQDTLKLIGFTTDNVVFSRLNNEELFILDRRLDTLSLKSKEKTKANTMRYFFGNGE